MKKIIPNFYQLFLTCFLVMSGWTAWGQPTTSAPGVTTGAANAVPRQSISFNWSTIPGTSNYRIQIYKSKGDIDPWGGTINQQDFPNDANLIVNQLTGTTPSFTITLDGGYSYAWQVRSSVAPNTWSNRRFFWTKVDAPLLNSPSDGATVPLPFTFSWSLPANNGFNTNNAAGMTTPVNYGYKVQISTSASFVTTLLNQGYSSSTTSLSSSALSLTASTTYYWRVQAYNPDPSTSDWSIVRSFVVQSSGGGGSSTPAVPTGISATASSSSSTSITWNSVSGATSYQLFRGATQVGGTLSTTSYTDTGLSASTLYCYTVQACNGNGCSSSSNQSCATTLSGGGGCTLSLNPTSNSVISTGGSGSFTVNATTGQGWSAFSLESWLSINSGINGNGNGTVSYAVANNTGIARSGTFTINCGSSSQTFTIDQAGSSTSTSTLTVNQAVLNFVASGLPDATIDVTSNTSWSVAVDGNPSWVSGLGWPGTGNNQFSVEVQPNTGTNQRTATMRVRTSDNAVERVITITQDGVSLTLNPVTLISPIDGEVFNSVPPSVTFTWDVGSNDASATYKLRLREIINGENGTFIETTIPNNGTSVTLNNFSAFGGFKPKFTNGKTYTYAWRVYILNPSNPTDDQFQTASVRYFEIAAPKLEISSFIVSPTPWVKGEQASATVTVINNGNADFIGDIYMSIHKYNNPTSNGVIADLVKQENITLIQGQTTTLIFNTSKIISNAGGYSLYVKQFDGNWKGIDNPKYVEVFDSNTPSLDTNVPNTIMSPVIGDLVQNTNGVGSTTTKWAFWQRGCSSDGGHCIEGGISKADDRKAWDANLTPEYDTGKPVYAVEDGIIVKPDGWGGNSYGQLLIKHETDGKVWYSGYLHMRNKKSEGFVFKGEQIGIVSNVSPQSIPNHLHFVVYYETNAGKLISVNRTIIPRYTADAPNDPMMIASGSVASSVPLVTGTQARTFTFNTVSNATRYWLFLIPENSDANTPPSYVNENIKVPIGMTNFSLTLPSSLVLQEGVVYKWRVRAYNGTQSSPSTTTAFRFKIQANTTPQICESPLTAQVQETSPTSIKLSWQSTDAQSYTVEIYQGNTSITGQSILGTTNFTNISFLVAGINYRYVIKSVCGVGKQSIALENSFSISTPAPITQQGVTVIIHGYTLPTALQIVAGGSNPNILAQAEVASEWKGLAFDLAKKVGTSGKKASVFVNNIESGTWEFLVGDKDISGEIILIYDWGWASNNVNSKGYLEASADNLFAMLLSPPLNINRNAFFNKPFHFIAHSRGTVLANQVFYRFQKHFPNIKFGHFTALDPHPALGMDDNLLNGVGGSFNCYGIACLTGITNTTLSNNFTAKLKLPKNVLKCDNYYRQDGNYEIGLLGGTFDWFNFDGIPIQGAFNRPLNNENLQVGDGAHSVIGTEWYGSTINKSKSIPTNWFVSDIIASVSNTTRDNTGYYYSRIGGGYNQLPLIPDADKNNALPVSDIFNGDFKYYGLGGYIPGWEKNGGSGIAPVVLGSYLELRTDLLAKRDFRQHSNMYVPINAKSLRVRLKLVSSCDPKKDKLSILFESKNPQKPSNWGNSNLLMENVTNTFQDYYFEINPSDVGKVGTLNIQIEGHCLSKVFTVQIDEIEFSEVVVSKIHFKTTGSELSGSTITRFKNNKQTEISNQADIQGQSSFSGILSNLSLGDSLLVRANGYDSLIVETTNDILSRGFLHIPMLRSLIPDNKLMYPSLKVLHNKITNVPFANLKITAKNLAFFRVAYDGRYSEPYPISDSLFTMPLDTGMNSIDIQLIGSINDTIYLSSQVYFAPSDKMTLEAYKVLANVTNEVLDAKIYVDGIYEQNVSNLTFNIPLLVGLHELRISKMGYEDNFIIIEGLGGESLPLNISLIERSMFDNNAKIVDCGNPQPQYYRAMTFQKLTGAVENKVTLRRYNKDYALNLKPQSETFILENGSTQAGAWTGLRGAVVLDQPEAPHPDSIYVLWKNGDAYKKVLKNQWADSSIVYEPETQKLALNKIRVRETQEVTLMQRLAPVPVTQQTDHQTYRGLVYKFHWNQVFADPDLLPNDMEVLVTDNAGLVTYMEGDSICVKLNNCNIGLYTLTLKATHDGLERTNTVKVLFKAPLISFTKTDVACWGGEDGEIAINIFGNAKPQTVKWNNGMVGDSINTLKAATYTFTSTDANGCTDVFAITIGQPDSLYLELTPLHISCFGLQDGKSQLKVFGGTAPYTYTWRKLNGTEIIASTQNITDLDDEAFEVTVTDAKGCFKKATMLIQEPEQLKVTLKVTPPDCPTAKNGKVEAIVTGGRPPYSIEHSKGNNRFYFIATDLGATDAVLHQVLVKDANNTCVATAEIAIISYPLATATITTQPICFGDNPKVKVQYNGQVFPYHIILSNGTDTKQFNNLMDSTFIYTVNNPVSGSIYKLTKVRYGTDICEADLQNQGEAKIIVWDLPKLSRVNVEAYDCTPRQNQAQIWWKETDIVGGQAPFLYSIDGGVTFQPEPRFEALVSGNYQVLTQDANGCEYQYPNQIVIPEDFAECIFQQVPNFISPNGDGINDVLEIAPLKYYPQSIVKIMNRGGKVLFESLPGYPTLWDGTYNGQELSFGAYYIYCDLRDGSKPYRGTVSIVR